MILVEHGLGQVKLELALGVTFENRVDDRRLRVPLAPLGLVRVRPEILNVLGELVLQNNLP